MRLSIEEYRHDYLFHDPRNFYKIIGICTEPIPYQISVERIKKFVQCMQETDNIFHRKNDNSETL